MDAETFAETYHDAYKDDARDFFQALAEFIEGTLGLVGRDNVEHEYRTEKLIQAELVKWLETSSRGLSTLESSSIFGTPGSLAVIWEVVRDLPEEARNGGFPPPSLGGFGFIVFSTDRVYTQSRTSRRMSATAISHRTKCNPSHACLQVHRLSPVQHVATQDTYARDIR